MTIETGVALGMTIFLSLLGVASFLVITRPSAGADKSPNEGRSLPSRIIAAILREK